MKITRRQLRQLIGEAMSIEEQFSGNPSGPGGQFNAWLSKTLGNDSATAKIVVDGLVKMAKRKDKQSIEKLANAMGDEYRESSSTGGSD